jgi:membrane protein DedA with SNARE-associated domain
MSTSAASGPRWQRGVVLALVAVSVTAAIAGNALTPVLLRTSPVALLAVLSSYAQMGLASARVDPVTLIAVAALRRWVGETIAYAAGRVFGGEALVWDQRRSGATLRFPERLNQRWWWLRDMVVVAVPHPLLSAFFGVTRMPPARFVLLKLAGSVLTVTAFWYATQVAALPLGRAADFVEANTLVLTVVVAGAIGVWIMRSRRQGARRDRRQAGAPSTETGSESVDGAGDTGD